MEALRAAVEWDAVDGCGRHLIRYRWNAEMPLGVAAGFGCLLGHLRGKFLNQFQTQESPAALRSGSAAGPWRELGCEAQLRQSSEKVAQPSEVLRLPLRSGSDVGP